MLRKVLVISCLVVMQVLGAQAETITKTVGGTDIKFVVPEGFCALSGGASGDEELDAFLKGISQKSEVFITSIGCKNSFVQAGRYFVYYSPTQFIHINMQGERSALIKNICEQYRAKANTPIASAPKVISQEIKENSTEDTTTNFLGVLQEDEHACYSGLFLHDKKTGNTFIAVISATIIKSKMIFSGFWERTEPEGVIHLLERAQGAASQLDAANQ